MFLQAGTDGRPERRRLGGRAVFVLQREGEWHEPLPWREVVSKRAREGLAVAARLLQREAAWASMESL